METNLSKRLSSASPFSERRLDLKVCEESSSRDPPKTPTTAMAMEKRRALHLPIGLSVYPSVFLFDGRRLVSRPPTVPHWIRPSACPSASLSALNIPCSHVLEESERMDE